MSLRTSAHTGVAIRFPAVKPSKLVLLQANPYALFRIRPKYCFLLCPAARRTDCHVASLLAMTGENLLRVRVCQEVLPESVLAPAETHLSSACHCEPVRTLVWQSASPQRNLASGLLLGQIRDALRIRPKYCFLLCSAARRCGLPRPFAPRNDMLKLARCPHSTRVLPG